MKNLFDLNSPFMRLLNFVADLIILNLLWILGCIPIVTIGASTTALYQCLMRYHSDAFSGVVQEFKSAFRSNLKQATILLFIILAIIIMLVADVWIVLFLNNGVSLAGRLLSLIPFLIPVLTLGYIFPLQAKFETGVLQLLKNAWMMTLAHLWTSALVLILNLTPAIILVFAPNSFLGMLMVWIFLGGSVIAWLNTILLQRVFQQYIPEANLSIA